MSIVKDAGSGGMAGHQVRAMFHSTAMVQDYDLAVDRLRTLFGLRVLECSVQSDPRIGRRGGMTWIGDGAVEIGEPIVAGAPPDRFVRRTGGGMQGVAVWVKDYSATVERLAAWGVGMPISLGGFGFSSPSKTFGLQFEWSEFTVDEDPRTGAPELPLTTTPLVNVTHLAFVDDPGEAALGLANLGLDITFEAPSGDERQPVAGVTLGDCTLALFGREPAKSMRLWGRAHDRPRRIFSVCASMTSMPHARRCCERT